MPKKEPAQNVNQMMLDLTDLPQITNNVSGVGDAETALFGNAWMSKSAMNSHGSNSGSGKAIRSADSPGFPATAISKSNKSKIIGLRNAQSATRISPRFDTSSMMGLISEEITASSPS